MRVKDLEIIHVEVSARTTNAKGSLWSSQSDEYERQIRGLSGSI